MQYVQVPGVVKHRIIRLYSEKELETLKEVMDLYGFDGTITFTEWRETNTKPARLYTTVAFPTENRIGELGNSVWYYRVGGVSKCEPHDLYSKWEAIKREISKRRKEEKIRETKTIEYKLPFETSEEFVAWRDEADEDDDLVDSCDVCPIAKLCDLFCSVETELDIGDRTIGCGKMYEIILANVKKEG